MLASLLAIGEDYEATAQTLGAGAWQRFRRVILPLVSPSLAAAAVLSFAFALARSRCPFLLGQRYPSALPVLAYRSYVDVDLNARPEAMAISMVISAITAAAVAALHVASHGGARHKDSVMRTLFTPSGHRRPGRPAAEARRAGSPEGVPGRLGAAGSAAGAADRGLHHRQRGRLVAQPAALIGLMDSYHALYFNNPLWIVSHNLFHAPFVIAVLFLVSVLAERHGLRWGPALRWLALGLALHSAVDILTHHDDGPLLFFPFDWRYRFPARSATGTVRTTAVSSRSSSTGWTCYWLPTSP